MSVGRIFLGRRSALLLLLYFTSIGSHAASFDPGLTWNSLHGQHFVVHFHDGEKAEAGQVLAIAEKVHARLSPEFHWAPQRPTDLILVDSVDSANGYASVFPSNRILIFPTSPNYVEDYDQWLTQLITHEYTHILHLDKAAGLPLALRNVFGRNGLLFPNTFQPSWWVEGLATWHETDTVVGVGRGQSSEFDMFMRMEVARGLKPLRQINQPNASWPRGMGDYLYGVEFYKFLASSRGEGVIQKGVDNYSDNLIPFRLLSNSRLSYGETLPKLYDEFKSGMELRYGAELARIRAQGVTAGVQVTHEGGHTALSRAAPDGTLYYVRSNGSREERLFKMAPGAEPQSLAWVHSVTSLDVHSGAGVLVSQVRTCRNTSHYQDLFVVSAETGAVKRLTECGRYRFAAWSGDGKRIAAVKNELGQNHLDLLDSDGRLLESVWQGQAGEVLIGIDWSPDGTRLLSSVWRPRWGWRLEEFILAERRWQALTSDHFLPHQPSYSADGAAVLFSVDYDGVFNLYRLSLADSTLTRLTNVEGGAFNVSQGVSGGPLYYAGYSGDGYDIYRLDQPLSQSVALPDEPPSLPAPAIDPVEGADVAPYSSWSSLKPTWWMPFAAYTNKRLELGASTSGWDVLLRHQYAASLGRDVDNQRWFGGIDYVYDRWRPSLRLSANRWYSYFRDTNDSLKRIRYANAFETTVVFPWLDVDQRFAIHVGARWQHEGDDWRAQGVSGAGSVQDNLLGVAFEYASTQWWPQAVSRGEGRELLLVVEDADALQGTYSGDVYTFDWREFFNFGERQVLGLRGVVGWGGGASRPFQLGGNMSAGNVNMNGMLMNLSVPKVAFNMRSYPLRGYDQGLLALEGQRMALASAEWRFPLRLIERGWMAPPVGLYRISGTFFMDSGSVWNEGRQPGQFLTGAGAELNVESNLFYFMRLRMRLGYAHGFDTLGQDQYYFQVGSSF